MTLKQHRTGVLGEPLRLVADRAGVHLSLLSMIERGLHVSKFKRSDIAKGYRVSIEDFKRLCGETVGGPSDENRIKSVCNVARVSPRGSKSASK